MKVLLLFLNKLNRHYIQKKKIICHFESSCLHWVNWLCLKVCHKVLFLISVWTQNCQQTCHPKIISSEQRKSCLTAGLEKAKLIKKGSWSWLCASFWSSSCFLNVIFSLTSSSIRAFNTLGTGHHSNTNNTYVVLLNIL